jgi:PDZ domain-containing protein
MEPTDTEVVETGGVPGDGVEDWSDVPPSLRPRRASPRWPFFVVGLLGALVAAIILLWPVHVPYFALSPGPVNDVGDFVDIADEVAMVEDSGELFFLTVSVSPRDINVLEAVWGWLDPKVDIVPRESIRPVGVSQEELRQQNLDAMDLSKQTAIVVALERLGYEVTFKGNGALVTALVEDGPAAGILEANDVIVAVDSQPVEFSDDAVAVLSGLRPGDTVTLDVRRPTDESGTEFEDFSVTVTLGVFRFVDEDGNENVDEDRGMVGVLLTNFDVETVLPIDIEIDSQNIGGPSAGMMFTLEIMNQLTEEDLTAGRVIAGTGTIARDGSVGPIGGVRQKVFAAIAAGADVVLVPAGSNYVDALEAADDDIEVVSIGTIDDAIAFLETL